MNILQKVMACIVLLIAVCAMCVAVAVPFCLITLTWFPSLEIFAMMLLSHGLMIGLILDREKDSLDTEMSKMGTVMSTIALTWFFMSVAIFVIQYLYIHF